MSDEALEGCPLSYICDEKWEQLLETPHPNIRHCQRCASNVHWVETKAELDNAKSLQRCVAFRPLDISENIARAEDTSTYDIPQMGRF